jgi:uncharacterized membrane protein
MPSGLLITQKSSSKGMLFVRIGCILTTMVRAPVVAVCFVILTLSSFVQYALSDQKILNFTIYSDGTTHVFYQTDVDLQSPDFTLNLYGKSATNLIVQDENGTILSSKVNENTITVETLGSSMVKVNFDTQDLVSKNGKTWTFHVDSPTDYSILLPKNTVIIGINTSPLNMQVIDDQSLISLPSGSSEINYVFSISGTSQTANLEIQKAENFIDVINSTGVKTPMAIAKLNEAKSNFNQGKYSDAESLANLAKNIALQEQQTNGNSIPKNSSDILLLPLLIVVSIIVGGVIMFIILKKIRYSNMKISSNKIPNTNYTYADKDMIYKLKPDLRQDDKHIIAFISEKGGQVYESELRKKFLMPRTTMWRAVKRLEREDIVEIEKVDQQNLIKLRKIEEDKK